jgi:glycerol-3-phosphate cytidylyltransferase-like family protein
MSFNRSIILMFSIVSILLCGASGIKQKTDDTIILSDEKIKVTPKEFYISGVVDERKAQGPVATLIYLNPDRSLTSKPVDLKGGVGVSVRDFILRNLDRNTEKRALILGIKELKLTEEKSASGRINGRLAVVFSFSLKSKYDKTHLVDFAGGMRYDRAVNQLVDIEGIIRMGMEGVISDFNDWMNNNAGISPLLAKAVKVRFTDYTETPEGDTIYYSAQRPLTWDDFKDQPRDNRFEAEILPVMGYLERNQVVKGIIYVDMAIKVSVAKSDCWVKGLKDDYMLNHEQRHFDIEKIVSERFKRKLLAMTLQADNFYGTINMEYLEALREATRIQKQYDAETRHSQDHAAQSQWNEQIDKELREYGVKK